MAVAGFHLAAEVVAAVAAGNVTIVAIFNLSMLP